MCANLLLSALHVRQHIKVMKVITVVTWLHSPLRTTYANRRNPGGIGNVPVSRERVSGPAGRINQRRDGRPTAWPLASDHRRRDDRHGNAMPQQHQQPGAAAGESIDYRLTLYNHRASAPARAYATSGTPVRAAVGSHSTPPPRAACEVK